MHDETPYAYSLSGNLIVLADGPELLAYSGNNDQGIWKLMCEDILLGVGVTDEQVLAVNTAGRITACRPIDGHKLFELDTDTQPITMRVSPDGHCVILEDQGIGLVRPGSDPLRVAWSSPRQVAWGPDSASIGLGSEDGTFAVVDPGSGVAWASLNLGSPITGVAWRANGTWAVAHGQQISFVKLVSGEEGSSLEVTETLPVGLPVGEVAVSLDGSLLAVIAGTQAVHLYELANNVQVGDVSFQRDVGHIQFGPKFWLGFGFDYGDANRLDVSTGKITRTQAHQGRGQNAWAMNVSLNEALVRGAIANVAASGQAIAAVGKVKADKRPGKGKRGKNRTWLWVAGIGGGAMVALIFCCGGGGLLTTFFGFGGFGFFAW